MTCGRLILSAVQILFQKFPEIENHSDVLLYGSAMNGKGFRDIDLLVISDKIDNILVYRYFVNGKIVNAYVIDRLILEQDVVSFAKGRFYSYKLAFGVKLLYGSGLFLRDIFKKFVSQTLRIAENYLKSRGIIKMSSEACTIKQIVRRILLYRLCIDKSFFATIRRLCSSPELLQNCVDRYQRILSISNTRDSELYEFDYKSAQDFTPSRITILGRYWNEYFCRQFHGHMFQRLRKTVKKFYWTRPHSDAEFQNLYDFLYREATSVD